MKYICIYIRNKKINMKICYTIKIDFDNPCENEQLCKPPRRGGGKKLSHYGDLEYIDNNDTMSRNNVENVCLESGLGLLTGINKFIILRHFYYLA